MAIHFFVNFGIFKWLYLAYFWVYLHQTWEFCKAWSALYAYCLISNREGLGTSLYIMGLETIDPHSQKEHTEIHKIPKFGVNYTSFYRDRAI